MLSPAERNGLLLVSNRVDISRPRDVTVHGLFEAQVARSPGATAVVFNGHEISYLELNARANQLAHHLRGLGVGRESLVGVWMDRSTEMIVALLGVLKAGGAYVPLDPAFPQDRIKFMMADADLGVIVTESRPRGRTLWTHAKVRPPRENDHGVVVGDVTIYDEHGVVVGEWRNTRLLSLADHAGSALSDVPRDWYYETRWQARDAAGPCVRRAEPGLWLIFADHHGVAAGIAARRAAIGMDTIVVTSGDRFAFGDSAAVICPTDRGDYARLIELAGRPTVIIHAWSLDATALPAGIATKEFFAAGPESVLHLLQSLIVGDQRSPRIWLLTSGAQAVADREPCSAPWNAALWGIGKTLPAEHAALWGGIIDLDPSATDDTAADLVIREINAGTVADKTAWRGGRRYVPALAHLAVPGGCADAAVRADGTYLITGGLGGIGLAAAQWLVQRGARHVLLLGRTPLAPRERWCDLDPTNAAGRRVGAVAALEAAGARVEAATVDVGCADDIARCLVARRLRGEPPVRGIIHAAGVPRITALAAEDVASLRDQMSGKAVGAWHLHQLCRSEPLDFFVVCSSSAALLLNSPLLGAYAAANAVLDALAHLRRASGLTALTINWGGWGEVGMDVDARGARGGSMIKGMGTISTARGLAAFGELVAADIVQAAVMPMDWRKFARAYPAVATDSFLELVVRDLYVADAKPAAPSIASLLSEPSGARLGLIAAYLRTEAARVLGIARDRLDVATSLSALGFDSLMAVQLKNRIEADLGVTVPMITFLHGPSVEQLASPVLAAVETSPPVPQDREGPPAGDWEEGTL
jgi:NAD(P)-dependent dehydrogenase (short-subunit alcohol dehydrogenase family)/acyl carrier protein